MTCIAAIQTPNGILLGADSAVDFGTHTALVDDKLFQCAGMWAGGAGDSLAIQYVRHTMPVIPPRTRDVLTWAAKNMAPCLLRVRSELVEVDDSIYAEFLFAHPRQLFLATIRGEILPCTRGFAAIGSGAEYAMAAIHLLQELPIKERMERAIRTASYFAPGSVQPPVRMQWVPAK